MEKALECGQKGKRKNGACCEPTGSKSKDGRRPEQLPCEQRNPIQMLPTLKVRGKAKACE